MALWNRQYSLSELDAIGVGSASSALGIRYTGIGDDWVEATIPLDARTRSADGSLHPGALAILAETVGSVAAALCIDNARRSCVGQILHVNHPTVVTAGPVRARASNVSKLSDSHIWDIEFQDLTGTVIGAARLTMAIRDRDGS